MLTLGEPVLRCLFINFHQRRAPFHMIRSLVQHAIFKSVTKNRDDLVLNCLVALELNVGFEYANLVVCVALINRRNSSELFMIPRILFTIRLDDFFYGAGEKNYAIKFR